MSQALTALERFLALTEAMAEASTAQEWDSLARLGEERSALSDGLPTTLSIQLAPAERDPGQKMMERCQQLDVQTRQLVEAHQKSLRILLREPNPLS